MKELLENEAFCAGIVLGINICQQKIIKAYEQKEPLKVGEDWYYVQDGRERLQEVLEKICK